MRKEVQLSPLPEPVTPPPNLTAIVQTGMEKSVQVMFYAKGELQGGYSMKREYARLLALALIEAATE